MNEIIQHLRKNARKTVSDISKETGIPATTIHNKISNYEKDAIIKGYTCILDLKKLGYPIKANIALKIMKEQRKSFQDFILSNNSINSASRINSGFDFMIEAIFRDMGEFHNFLEEINEKFIVENKQIFYSIADVKSETFLSGGNE
jgi:Lrp/AsnC family leucine-responsive transcriptional regulator